MPNPTLENLRSRIAALEGASADDFRSDAALPLGPASIDGQLPWGGLKIGDIHDIAPASTAFGQDGAALGFAAALLGKLAAMIGKPVLWLAENTPPHAPGLAAFGLAPSRLVVVRPGKPVALAWALEEAARSAALAGILGEVRGLDFTMARRLHLAARDSATTVLLLNRGPAVNPALSRWRIKGLAGADDRWRLDLLRYRGRCPDDSGLVARWEVDWHAKTGNFSMVAASGHRPAEPGHARVA